MPKVSVLVPTFNRVDFLEKALISILSQDFDDYEIIVSDNASTDGTEEMIRNIDTNKILYHKNNVNLGMIGNHNKVLDLARGEYLHIFSDDDMMCQSSISKKVRVMDKNPSVGLVHSDMVIIDENDKIISKHWASSYFVDWNKLHNNNAFFRGMEYFKYLYYHWNIISMPSVMLRASIVKDNNLRFADNLKFAMDLDMWMKVCLFSDVYYINDVLVKYRIHTNNAILAEDDKSSYKEFVLIKNNFFNEYGNILKNNKIKKSDIEKDTRRQIIKYPLGKYVEPTLYQRIISRLRRLLK